VLSRCLAARSAAVISSYTGYYKQDADEFVAVIASRRHTQGQQPSVFGIDSVDVTLTGKSTTNVASCSGVAKQAPDLTFEATLIRIDDQQSSPGRAIVRPIVGSVSWPVSKRR
jgi:hypothetical protein